jgi:hypothetical protein
VVEVNVLGMGLGQPHQTAFIFSLVPRRRQRGGMEAAAAAEQFVNLIWHLSICPRTPAARASKIAKLPLSFKKFFIKFFVAYLAGHKQTHHA